MKNFQTQPTNAPVSGSRNFFLSLIIPCYNESSRVEIMLQGLAEFNEKWKGGYEVIVVDDGSKDNTAQKIQEVVDTKYAFLKDKLTIEVMPANGGKGSALKRGVSLAKGDYILTLDADMSTRPTELINWERKVKDLFTNTNAIHIGSRKHEEGKVEALQSRRLIGGVFNNIVQVFTTLKLKDTQCGFKLYPRQVALMLFGNMQSKGWAHDVELLYQADLNDIAIVEMPIYWVNQPESKVNVIKDSFMMFIGVLTISLRIWLYNSFVLPFKMPAAATPAQKKQIISRSVFNVLCLLLVIVMPIMSFQYTITGDEHWHFDYGNDIYNYFFHGDTNAQTTTSGIQYYGGIFDFITASFYHLFHVWDHYTTMHFCNALVGAVGIIYAGKLAKLFGGWSAGLLAIIFLVLSPSWFGHNFANPKDIPFSVGYTAGIYYILLFLQALPAPSFKHLLGLVCSIGWAMGVRIGGLLLIAYLVLFIGCYAVFTRQMKTIINARLIRQVIVVAILGYAIAIIFWPYSHMGIITKPLEALKIMSNFFIDIAMLYDGKSLMSSQVPWYYIPKYILYTAPLIVLAGIVIGCLSLPLVFRKKRSLLLFALFLLFCCVFPVAYAVYKKSSLYDGWRHFLFIYPPLVVIASIGWSALINSKQVALKYVAIAVIVIGLVAPARFAAANHRYESLYYNEVAGGLKGIYGQYETDYYMLGVKDAAEWLLKNEHIDGRKTIIGTNCTYPLLGYLYQSHYKQLPAKYEQIYERFADFRHDSVYERYNKENADFEDKLFPWVVYVKSGNKYAKDWDYCILFSRDEDQSKLATNNWPPSETIYTVKVDGVPIAAVLKRKTKKDFEGFTLEKAKKIVEAKAMFLEAVKEHPQNDAVWGELADIYDAEAKSDSVIYAGNKALATYPGDFYVYRLMGNQYMKMGQPENALKLYNKLLTYNAAHGHLLLSMGYATIGDINRAYSEIDESIAADPYNDQTYKVAMQIARRTKNAGKEQEYYEKAIKVFPQAEAK